MSKMNFPDKETVREMRAYANMNKFEKMLEKAGHDRLSSNIEKVAAISGIMRVLSMGIVGGILGWVRSEEHRSELQSLMRISYAVFCLQKKQQLSSILFS